MGTEDSAIGDEQYVDRLCAWLDSYCRRRLNLRLMDERRTFSPHLILDFGRAGLLGLMVPEDYGGRPVSIGGFMRIMRQLGGIDATLALFVGLTNVLGARPIAKAGTPVLRERFLPDLAAGRMLGAFALTEPAAGSHPGGLRSIAVPSREGWLLSGTKWLSGLAAWSGVINTFARVPNPGGGPGAISAFCIPTDRPGVVQGPEALTIGMRSMIQNEVRFQDVHVDSEERLGEAGAGLAVAQDGMGLGRLVIAAAAVGLMGRCLAVAHQYASLRRIATGLLLTHPHCVGTLWELAGSAAALEKLVTVVAEAIDCGRPVPSEILAACKVIGGEESFRCADSTLQILGGRGYLETEAIARTFRDARVLRIFEGPTEALLHHIGSSALRPASAIWSFLADELNAGDLSRRTIEQLLELRSGSFAEEQRRSVRLNHTFLAGGLVVRTIHLAAGRLVNTMPTPARQSLETRFESFSSELGRIATDLRRGVDANLAELADLVHRLGSADGIPAPPYEEGRVSQLLAGLSPSPAEDAAGSNGTSRVQH